MALRLVGAGLGRTGTNSLKIALERLLGAPCHHMVEVFAHPEQVPHWHAAARGEMPDWNALFAGYAAAVDWPSASFWPEISAAFPDAPILLSERDPASWWKSASSTIFPSIGQASGEWRAMIDTLFANRFTRDVHDRDAAIAAYEAHYADALRRIPPERLVRWRASDGWEPLCRALGVAVPDEPFPHTNTTEQFQAHLAPRVPGSGS